MRHDVRMHPALLDASRSRPSDEVAAASLSVVRRLVARGFLLPPFGGRG